MGGLDADDKITYTVFCISSPTVYGLCICTFRGVIDGYQTYITPRHEAVNYTLSKCFTLATV